VLLDVIFREPKAITVPLGFIVHNVDAGGFELLINFRRRGETNFCPETVLLRTKDDEIVGLTVFSEPDVELVVFQFELRREGLDEFEYFVSQGNGLFGAPVLPVIPIGDGLNFLVLLRHAERECIDHLREHKADLFAEIPGTHLKCYQRNRTVEQCLSVVSAKGSTPLPITGTSARDGNFTAPLLKRNGRPWQSGCFHLLDRDWLSCYEPLELMR